MLSDSLGVSKSDHIDLLVRAFKAAWDFYFEPGRNTGVLECLARPAVAEFLVSKVREGIDDVPSLAAAGLEFLFSLEDIPAEEPVVEPEVRWDLHLEKASARFLPVWMASKPSSPMVTAAPAKNRF
jgi:hypothetical protein